MPLARKRMRALFSATSLLMLIAASQPDKSFAQAPAEKIPSGDPCSVVPLTDVKAAFPGAKPGERSTRTEKYGITECTWKDAAGQVVFGVQEFYGKDSAKEELKSLATAMVNMNTANLRNVRFETLTGIGLGNDAVAFVEAQDPKRGIATAGAMLALHRGDRTLWLTSLTLPTRDRAAALKTFEVLGRIAAKRLQ